MNNTQQHRQSTIDMNLFQSARAIAFRPAVAAVLLGLFCSPSAALAALITYTSEATWQAAVMAPTLINFDSLADGAAVSNQYSGVTFSPFNSGNPVAIVESNPYSFPVVLAVD